MLILLVKEEGKKGARHTVVVHAIHHGHESFQSLHRFLFVTFGHEIGSETRNHALKKVWYGIQTKSRISQHSLTYHNLAKRPHLHDILELLVHVAKGELT